MNAQFSENNLQKNTYPVKILKEHLVLPWEHYEHAVIDELLCMVAVTKPYVMHKISKEYCRWRKHMYVIKKTRKVIY